MCTAQFKCVCVCVHLSLASAPIDLIAAVREILVPTKTDVHVKHLNLQWSVSHVYNPSLQEDETKTTGCTV